MDTKFAYIAGLVDGEGCISIVHQKTRGNTIHVPYINIANTHKSALDFVKNTVGFGFVRLKHCSTKEVYYYEVRSRLCMKFVKLIYPYIIIKKDQINLLIEFYNVIISSGNNNYADLSIAKLYCTKMRELHYGHNHNSPRYTICNSPYLTPQSRGYKNVKILKLPKDSLIYEL